MNNHLDRVGRRTKNCGVEWMSGYVVFVDFHLKPGALEKFRELVDAKARHQPKRSQDVAVST
jgi:hypothetical protein